MPELDSLKEELAYLKLWLGVLIVTIISLIGWLLANYRVAELALLVTGCVTLLVLCSGGYFLHRKIEAKISQVKEL